MCNSYLVVSSREIGRPVEVSVGGRPFSELMTPRIPPRARAGFTLVETVVTLGLLAVLAAFVVPTVVQKAGAGDPVKLVSDLGAIRTSLATFQADLGEQPNQLRMLIQPPTTANHFIDSVTALTPGQVAAWAGPYLNAEIGPLATDSLSTGFKAYLKNAVVRYDATNNAPEFAINAAPVPGAVFNPSNLVFASVTIVGLSASQAQTINRLMDGDGDMDVPAGPNAGANLQGRVRYGPPNAAGAVVMYHLVAPLAR